MDQDRRRSDPWNYSSANDDNIDACANYVVNVEPIPWTLSDIEAMAFIVTVVLAVAWLGERMLVDVAPDDKFQKYLDQEEQRLCVPMQSAKTATSRIHITPMAERPKPI